MDRFKALMMVAILVIGSIGIVVVYRNTGGPGEREDEIEPEIMIKFRDNYGVATVPESNNEPHIAVNPTNPDNIVAGGNDYGTPNGDSWCGYYWSDDGGVNWTRGLIPGYPLGPPSVLTGYEGAGDPVIAFDSNGNCYYAGIAFKRINMPLRGIGRQSAIFVAKSTDGGKTWPQVSTVFQAISRASFHDKEWIAVDPDTGYVYVVWAVFTAYTPSNMFFSRSTDGGQSWSRPIVVSEYTAAEFNVQGAGITVDSKGTIHVIWIDFKEPNQKMRYSYSTDKGSTFSEAVDIAPVNDIDREGLSGTTAYRTPTLPAIAADNSGTDTDGYLYVTWSDDSNGDADAFLVMSKDYGKSWGKVIRVNDDEVGNGKDQFFSTVCVSPQGYAQFIFYDRREDPANTLLNVYFAISVDGGETFYNMNITNTQFNGNYSRGPFMGDYLGIASSETYCHAIWADTRNADENNVNADLYSARIEIAEMEDMLLY